jgi:hypothetical protein
LAASIKRLTKPKFKYEHTHFHNPIAFQALPLMKLSELDEQQEGLMSINDTAYDGVESDAIVNYNSSFGKICTGEQFRVLFTIQNTNT